MVGLGGRFDLFHVVQRVAGDGVRIARILPYLQKRLAGDRELLLEVYDPTLVAVFHFFLLSGGVMISAAVALIQLIASWALGLGLFSPPAMASR